MTNNNHPITPSPELVQKWDNDWHRSKIKYDTLSTFVATQAARWGADEQLKMDATWVALQTSNQMSSKRLIAEMRPKPPSLKEQSIALIDKIQGNKEMWDIRDLDVIRQALECPPS